MSKRNKNIHSVYAEDLARSIELMFVASIRKGIEEGLTEAVKTTKKDSGNAAAHWMVGIHGGSQPSGRALGQPRDLRATNTKPVGKEGVQKRRTFANGKNEALKVQLEKNIIDRELNTVINQYAKGQKPAFKFYYFNAIGSEADYADNAMIRAAGAAGTKKAVERFEIEVARDNTRRHRLT